MTKDVTLKTTLGLRNNAHQVQIVQPNGAKRPVLGTSDPEEEQRRVNIVKQWGGAHEGPRHQAPVGIEQALPQRTQTILYYQLPEHERQLVNGGLGTSGGSRKKQKEVCEVTLNSPQDSAST